MKTAARRSEEEQDCLEKTIMLGKVEGSRKRGGPYMRWTDSVKEATGLSLQTLSRAVVVAVV